MNHDIKERWVAALRSGEYVQGTGLLNKNGKLCCLGVLCEIAVQDGIVLKSPDDPDADDAAILYWSATYSVDSSDTHLPLVVRKWAGLVVHGTDVKVYDSQDLQDTTLTQRNDSGFWPFKRIAALIEREL